MIITGKKFSKPALSRVINGDTQLATPDAAPPKVRLDHLLVQQHPEYNRSSLQTFIKSGFVTVDGQVVTKPNAKIQAGAKLILTLPLSTATPECPPVLYEDDHVLVLNKPAGLLSMAKGEYCPEPTLEDFGLLVHRLDRDTSGVVILAKDPDTQKYLRRQFQNRQTHKTYYAVTVGHPKLPAALIDLPIARNLKRPTTFQVDQNGKPSQTAYRVVAHTDQYSLLELKPTTGRTHQLRVHLKYLGTPILGDPVYGTPLKDPVQSAISNDNQSTTPHTNDLQLARRLYLHAYSLEITIPGPTGGERRTFTAPLPPAFTELFPDYVL